MLLKPSDDPGSDTLFGSLLAEAMLLKPTEDPGSGTLLGSLLTEAMLLNPDEMLPPYRGGVGAFECMDIRLESSDIARAEGLSCW